MTEDQCYLELADIKESIVEELYLNGLVFLHNAIFYDVLPENIYAIDNKLIFMFNSNNMLSFILTLDGKMSISVLEKKTGYTIVNINLTPYGISLGESFTLIKKYLV